MKGTWVPLLVLVAGLLSPMTEYATAQSSVPRRDGSELPRFPGSEPPPSEPPPSESSPAPPSVEPTVEPSAPESPAEPSNPGPSDLPDTGEPSEAATPEPRPYAPLRPRVACPADVETLVALMLRDIPSYANRVLQRSVAVLPGGEPDEWRTEAGLERSPYRPAYVLLAGRPELEPLDLKDYGLTQPAEDSEPLAQVFFTTLSRQYSRSFAESLAIQVNEVQTYHWLFLTPDEDGWWLALMFSAVDDPDTVRSPTPPRESSDSSVGQAVQLWLRDCRAGAIYLDSGSE